jgi:hypothetical protein
MKIFAAILISVTCIFAASNAFACSPGVMNEQVARQLDAVYIGEATASTWGEDDYQLLVTVKVLEVLKGKETTQIVAPLPCFRSIENGRKVIVFVKDGNPAAGHIEYFEEATRKALRRGR